jgi:hypothetical protein
MLAGFTAMAIDSGLFYQDRRHLQNSADAAALAGVSELPLKPLDARKKAEDWAAINGIPASQIKTIEVRTTDAPNDTLYVEVEKDFKWIFGRVLGMDTNAVSASAAAQIQSLQGSHNVMPWAILMGDSDCLDAVGDAVFSTSCTVKVGSTSSSISGWYGALDLDGGGGGSSEYESNIVDGEADTLYCVAGSPSPPCQSSVIDALSGNKVGGTGGGIDQRLATEPTCDANGNSKDDFDEVFQVSVDDPGSYGVACAQSPRLIFIPIVSLDGVPVKTVTIEGWALAYLKSYGCVGGGNCNGAGHWEVRIQIADSAYSEVEGFLGAYNSLSGASGHRLIQ